MEGVLTLVLAYLVGAIPFALVMGRAFRGVDIREHGSGNLGTTNTIRVLGWSVGLLVLAGDLGKGALAAYLGYRAGGMELGIIAGIVAVLGHVFPVYVGFRGGKGIAAGGGVFLYLMPPVFFLGISTFGVMLLVFRYVSLASLTAALVVGISASLLVESWFVLAVVWVTVSLVFYAHRSNIRRLLRGEESRVRLRKK